MTAKARLRSAMREQDLSPPRSERGAGILLHITSLPSSFGAGDLGPQAFAFADFLHRAKQKYWQVLPLNPVEKKQEYSPYSALSSMAGNTLVISPEALAQDELLAPVDLKSIRSRASGISFEEVEKVKFPLFEKAYQAFNTRTSSELHQHFAAFCRQESAWIDDFALYMMLKNRFGAPWYEWPEAFRLRDPKTLTEAAAKHHDELQQIKWLQFIFSRQWLALKTYCNARHIKLFGDLPFYVSHDSADVWSNPEIFCLDRQGHMTGVAGVPPDYFNADGQLWGMPVFKWEALAETGYTWWIRRLSKNIERYDLLRLDHFRAFANFWEVPAREKTAIKGKWQPGPGANFFDTVKKELGTLPFVAEDLGDIDESVHALRRRFELPGMKILQFAFGDNLPSSDYIPHNFNDPNFLVYTGTHDNNTTLGWYRKDISQTERKNLETYFGKKVGKGNVHLELTRLAYSSVARIAMMPMQDVLGLNESARMNTPASITGNWTWQLQARQLKPGIDRRLAHLVSLFNRW